MRVSKTCKGTSPKKAKVSNEDNGPVKILDEEREFLAKTLGELLAWCWWKASKAMKNEVRKSDKE